MINSTELAGRVVAELTARGLTLATAESLTGGLIAAAITDVPGASAVLRGSVVAYATDVKAGVLGVDAELLRRVGAVDPDVAVAMAWGAASLLDADMAVACTGVAGPDSQDGHGPGTVFVAACGRDVAAVEQLDLVGDRQQIRAATVVAALSLVLTMVATHDTHDTHGSD